MGNTPSRSSSASSNPQTPVSPSGRLLYGGGGGSTGSSGSIGRSGSGIGGGGGAGGGGIWGAAGRQQQLQQQAPREPRRRGSIQALTTATTNKATAAPPSAVLESTTAHTFARASPHLHHSSSSSSSAAAARSRAHTAAATISSPSAPTFPPTVVVPSGVAFSTAPLTPLDLLATADRMGSDQSKPKAYDRHGHDRHSRDLTSPHTRSPPVRPSPHSRPVDVPAPAVTEAAAVPALPPAAPAAKAQSSPLVAAVPVFSEKFSVPVQDYNRPPRLPLPIEEEDYTPGSPIISPADLAIPLDPIDADGVLPRRTSMLSSTTVDDDEDEVDDFNLTDGEIRPTVQTLIEWRGEGERVYVTGTFAGWDRKFRLHRDGPSPHKGALSAYINLLPGTHHLKFIVDSEMRLSDDLPTAVDFTNILVNYIEVSPDQLSTSSPEQQSSLGGDHLLPSGAVTPTGTPQAPVIPPGLHPPQVLPPTPEIRPVAAPANAPSNIPEPPPGSSKPVPVEPGAPKEYHSEIPRFLADLDAAEDSHAFGRANAAVSSLPTPPTLPMFLSRSILNGATPMKDDASVLNMPNHTVLNHLATSSIRNNVLATSATTRYKRKFLTTIMYKPTNELGD